MKKLLLMGASVLAVILAVSSCQKNTGEDEPQIPEMTESIFSHAYPDSYYSYAEISVPVATENVYVKYTKRDGSVESKKLAVTPEIAAPEGGKDVEPFGTVRLVFESEKPCRVSVYYSLDDSGQAAGDRTVYVLTDFPVDQMVAHENEIGQVRYFMVKWDVSWGDYPKDLIYYDQAHNHTLRYTFAYGGMTSADGFGYVLTDAFTIEDRVVTGYTYNYCPEECAGSPYCMPWGCSCGCGAVNPDFVPSGDLTGQYLNDDSVIVLNPTTRTVTVDPHGTIIVDYAPASAYSVQLPEPENYLSKSGDFTMYHSSGVVMFDDSWPQLPEDLGGSGNTYASDYNDVVVDYDVEAVTVADHLLDAEWSREQVKVVLHVRALGSTRAWRVGMALENFNTDYVESVEEYKTLDSKDSGHGNLPAWAAAQRFQENSIHYDNFNQQFPSGTNLRPSIEIGQLQVYNGTKYTNAGTDEYTYINGANASTHVFNPAIKLWSAWGGPHTDQYDEVMAAVTKPLTLSQIQNFKFYNAIPGYVNQGGGLYTYTVVYKIKRAGKSAEESALCKKNMIDAVVNTTAQNFFIVLQDYGAIGLKGYAPLDYGVKDYSRGYKAKYNDVVAQHASTMDPGTYYRAANGQVWGFKCPTLTRHLWEKQSFYMAYPKYEQWLKSNGSQNADWYKLENANMSYLSCEW